MINIAPIVSKMNHEVYCCAPAHSLAQAAHVMWEKDCGWLPVVDGSGIVVGTITDRDICMAALTRGIRLDDERVDTVMARQVVSVREHHSIADVEQLMKVSQLRRFPVVDSQGQAIGVVTLTDLARAETHHGERGANGISGIASALAVIAEPHHGMPHVVLS
jgi:predicted transcriptional regulator